MGVVAWTWLLVGASFALFIAIALWSQARSTGDFYVAERQSSPILNGMATGADWMSAATFISMAGMISFMGRDGSMFLMGWTGGYVLLAMLLAPYLRKYGKFTVPQFVGDRYYSRTARGVALLCAILVSFVYVVAQLRGVGLVFARFLEMDIETGVWIGVGVVFLFASMGGMKGITNTQAAQYVVLIVAFLVPAVFVSIALTGNPVPQLAYGDKLTPEGARLIGDASASGKYLLDVLDQLHRDLGFSPYTKAGRPTIDTFAVTLALMVGTAGLPHIIIRFFTVPRIRDARTSAGWALLFIAILYTAAPAVGAFARLNFVKSISGKSYAEVPAWFKNWEKAGLAAWVDKDGDGRLDYGPGEVFAGAPVFSGETGLFGQRALENAPGGSANEVYLDNDVMVMANPEISGLPNWVIGLVAAGAFAAALSTAAGLLLVISAAISHDLIKGIVAPMTTERGELLWARVAAGIAAVCAGWFALDPPAHVAQIVALAFGFAASSFFPVIVLGIFWKKTTRQGAIAGMLSGILFTLGYVLWYKFVDRTLDNPAGWLFSISPEGIGVVGMAINFVVAFVVSKTTAEPPPDVQALVENLRYPKQGRPSEFFS